MIAHTKCLTNTRGVFNQIIIDFLYAISIIKIESYRALFAAYSLSTGEHAFHYQVIPPAWPVHD
jgi:hypothetical protein